MFEWDQYLFFLGYRNYKKIKKHFQNKNPFYEYSIEKNEAQLGKYILLLTGQNVLFHSEGNRIHLTSTTFTFPKKITLFKTESDSLKFVQIYIGLITFCYMNGTGNNPIQSLDPFRVYRKFQNKFPGWRKDWGSIRLKLNEIKKLDHSHFSKLRNIMNAAIHSVSNFEPPPKMATNPYKTIRAYDKEINESEIISDYHAAEVLEVNQKKIDEYTLGHNFEKIETAEEFEGQWRDIDGSEDMGEEAALKEVNLKFLIRSEDPVHSTQSIESSSGQVVEIQTSIENEISHFYDEWDYRKKIYKKEFCSLKESEFKLENISVVANILTQKKKTILQFQRKMSVLLNQRRIQKRLSYGCDFDLDALVNRYADIVAKV
jgi:nitric oxide reductase NorD protein